MYCLICNSNNMRKYYYPDVHFNGKIFSYYECFDCKSARIVPIPDDDDFSKMYGTTDHSYLLQLKDTDRLNFDKALSRYNHQNYQLYFLKKFYAQGKGKKLLDIGCGSGFYMYHATKLGYECTGIEFNETFCNLLSQKTDLHITTFDNINNKKFDLIHLGHFLEHTPNPTETIQDIKKYAHKDTLIIIDGPLEKNACLSRFIIKCGSKIKRKKYNSYPPQHITFTNYQSQLYLFEKCGLQKINYFVKEQMFPFPERVDIKKPVTLFLFIISRCSIIISNLNPRWGNIFHYAGRFK